MKILMCDFKRNVNKYDLKKKGKKPFDIRTSTP